MESESNKTQKLDAEVRDHPTIHLPERDLQLDNSVYMPRKNRGNFQSHALIVPSALAPEFHAGLLAGWHVEIHFTQQNAESLRLVIVGDTVIGRMDADINLDYFNGDSLGVSREHVMLRASDTQLYIIDMESTNGTLRNGLVMSSSRAYPVSSRDVITVGQLTFTLYILDHATSATTDPI